MQRTVAARKILVNVKPAAADPTSVPLTEGQAAEIMWMYYRDNKARLVSDIKEYRAGILVKLMDGIAVEEVFAPFVKPAEPPKLKRRNA